MRLPVTTLVSRLLSGRSARFGTSVVSCAELMLAPVMEQENVMPA